MPVGATVRVQVTGVADGVIHSWFVPSFGVQEYAVPGRLNESWFRVERAGTYYGECNQICGINHSQMPIEIVALAKARLRQMAWRREEEIRRRGAGERRRRRWSPRRRVPSQGDPIDSRPATEERRGL